MLEDSLEKVVCRYLVYFGDLRCADNSEMVGFAHEAIDFSVDFTPRDFRNLFIVKKFSLYLKGFRYLRLFELVILFRNQESLAL